MKRYKITAELREAIRNHPCSIRKMSRIMRFEVKNIYKTNVSINENHLKKLNSLLNLDLQLEEIKFDYVKNLGKYAFSPPIKFIRKRKDLAEFIGIMLGDGNIYQNQIKISFDKRNETYIKYVKKLIKKIFGIKLKEKRAKGTNQLNLYYYNKDFTEKLLKFGLKRGNKIKNKVGIPQWIKLNPNYTKKCIKGLIDTDGCILFCKRGKHKYVNFTSHNQKLLKDFKELTKNLGYSFAKSNDTNTRLYKKEQVVKFIKDIKPQKSKEGAVG